MRLLFTVFKTAIEISSFYTYFTHIASSSTVTDDGTN